MNVVHGMEHRRIFWSGGSLVHRNPELSKLRWLVSVSAVEQQREPAHSEPAEVA